MGAGGKAREAKTRQTVEGLIGHAEEFNFCRMDSEEQEGQGKMISFRKVSSWRQSKT